MFKRGDRITRISTGARYTVWEVYKDYVTTVGGSCLVFSEIKKIGKRWYPRIKEKVRVREGENDYTYQRIVEVFKDGAAVSAGVTVPASQIRTSDGKYVFGEVMQEGE